MRSFKVLVVKNVKHFQSKAGKQLVFKFFFKIYWCSNWKPDIFQPWLFPKTNCQTSKMWLVGVSDSRAEDLGFNPWPWSRKLYPWARVLYTYVWTYSPRSIYMYMGTDNGCGGKSLKHWYPSSGEQTITLSHLKSKIQEIHTGYMGSLGPKNGII